MATRALKLSALMCECNARNQTDAVAAFVELDGWLIKAGAYGRPAIATFAAGLKNDLDATRTALTKAWGSGQTEGQVNRL